MVTARPDNEHADLFDAFPNSYGSLGYATRLRIELEPVAPHVALRHVRFDDAGPARQDDRRDRARPASGTASGSTASTASRFAPGELYLTLAPVDPGRRDPRPPRPSDYTGQQIYYRSIQERETDLLTTYDYLWRWDTDWFWCSRAVRRPAPAGAPGVAAPVAALRRLPPAGRAGPPLRASSTASTGAPAGRCGSGSSRTSRSRSTGCRSSSDWFDREVGMRPVWLCPLRLRRDGAALADLPAGAGRDVRQRRLLGHRATSGRDAPHGPRNRAIEAKVPELGGHKSLYSEAFYDRETFDRLYDGANLAAVKARYDPDDRLTTPLRQGGEETMSPRAP